MKYFDGFLERYPLFRYIPGILLLAMIFRMSAIPGSGMTWLVSPFDKLVHGGVYAVLGACFCLWFANARWERRSCVMALCAAGLCLVAGILDEFRQETCARILSEALSGRLSIGRSSLGNGSEFSEN